MLEEASSERFIYPYMEQSSYSTIDFVKIAITYFGYKPLIVQTDNRFELTYGKKYPGFILSICFVITQISITSRYDRKLRVIMAKLKEATVMIRNFFYNHMSFYSYQDLMLQMKHYLNGSNNISMQVLGWKTS